MAELGYQGRLQGDRREETLTDKIYGRFGFPVVQLATYSQFILDW